MGRYSSAYDPSVVPAMTVGSWDHSDVGLSGFDGSSSNFEGLIERKQWIGGDKPPPVAKPPKQYVWIRYEIPARWYSNPNYKGKKPKKQFIPAKTVSKRLRIRSGWTPPPRSAGEHSYSMTYLRFSSPRKRDVWGVDYNTGERIYRDVLNSTVCGQAKGVTPGAGSSIWSANDTLKLQNQLVDKIRGADFDLSVALGESHQTLRMIGDAAIRIAKAYEHVRRGDVYGAARSLVEGTSRAPLSNKFLSGKDFSKGVANNWIELQYGWKPLIKDVYSGAQFLAARHSGGSELKLKVSRAVRQNGRCCYYFGSYNNSIWPAIAETEYRFYNTDYQIQHTKRLTLYVKEEPSLAALLGLADPQNVAWELTPWSFVADWFIPIGSYLSARGLSSIAHGIFVESDLYSSFATEPLAVGNGNGAYPRPQFEVDPVVGATPQSKMTRPVSGYFYCSYTRTVSTTAPSVPLPNFKSLSKAASWQHCANAVALLTQKWAGRG